MTSVPTLKKRKKLKVVKFPGKHPIDVNDFAWVYEERRGLLVVVEHRTDQHAYVGTVQLMLPWRLVARSALRFLAAKRAKAKRG